VVITNGELNPGYQVVQSTHSIADFAHTYKDIFDNWKQESNSIICLSAKNKEHLQTIYEKFLRMTPTVIFYEPDVDEHTSICLYGTPDVRKKLSHLPLSLKKQN
jgi:peptidyl-tRNA hydrolase